jgi:hypothetical protein
VHGLKVLRATQLGKLAQVLYQLTNSTVDTEMVNNMYAHNWLSTKAVGPWVLSYTSNSGCIGTQMDRGRC